MTYAKSKKLDTPICQSFLVSAVIYKNFVFGAL